MMHDAHAAVTIIASVNAYQYAETHQGFLKVTLVNNKCERKNKRSKGWFSERKDW